MKKTSRILLPAALLLLTSATVLAIAGLFSRTDDTISLAGEWKFALDPQDKGVSEKWSLKTVWGVGYKFELLD